MSSGWIFVQLTQKKHFIVFVTLSSMVTRLKHMFHEMQRQSFQYMPSVHVHPKTHNMMEFILDRGALEGGKQVASQLEGALLFRQNVLARDNALQSLQLLAHIRGAALGQHLIKEEEQ